MPYDPEPLPAATDAERLVVHVAGGGGETDCVFALARPADGRVMVHAMPVPGEPHTFDESAVAMLDRLEGARRAGRRVSVEGYALRHWLLGRT